MRSLNTPAQSNRSQNENGQPAKVLKIKGRYFKFDEAGRIDERCRRSIAQLSPDSKAATNDTVTRDNRWQLTKGDRERVAAQIWPKSNAQSVKGKPPSVPYETPARSSVRQHSDTKATVWRGFINAAWPIFTNVLPLVRLLGLWGIWIEPTSPLDFPGSNDRTFRGSSKL
jgi:hypothetical protein